MLSRRLALTIGAAVLAVSATLPLTAMARDRIEEPDYVSVSKNESFELRRYAPRIDAVVEVQADNAREASNRGFRLLADYIFGNNESRVGIEMTAPVGRSQPIEMTAPVGRVKRDNVWFISFTMPSKWTLDTLPRPKNGRVQIQERPAQHFAVATFRGAPGEQAVAKREADLRRAAQAAGLSLAPQPAIYNRYDPPWIPSLLRRNELWVAVDIAN